MVGDLLGKEPKERRAGALEGEVDTHWLKVHNPHKFYRQGSVKKNVSVAGAKQNLSDLLGRVAYGKESMTITRRAKPVAR